MEYFFGQQPELAKRITQEIQVEFSNRVLRPVTAQMTIERVANETVKVFLASLREKMDVIQAEYEIPLGEWDRYLSEISILTASTTGDRQVGLMAGGAAASILASRSLKPLIARIGTRIMGRLGNRKAVQIAGRSAAKVAGKVGGKFAGALVAVAIIAWDIWDHHHTVETQRPILIQKMSQHLREVKADLLCDPETGLMTAIALMRDNMLASEERAYLKRSTGGVAGRS